MCASASARSDGCDVYRCHSPSHAMLTCIFLSSLISLRLFLADFSCSWLCFAGLRCFCPMQVRQSAAQTGAVLCGVLCCNCCSCAALVLGVHFTACKCLAFLFLFSAACSPGLCVFGAFCPLLFLLLISFHFTSTACWLLCFCKLMPWIRCSQHSIQSFILSDGCMHFSFI